MLLCRNKKALTGIVCALKGIEASKVKDISVKNPIVISMDLKETVMDLKLTLNTNEIINIELQMYMDRYWSGTIKSDKECN